MRAYLKELAPARGGGYRELKIGASRSKKKKQKQQEEGMKR